MLRKVLRNAGLALVLLPEPITTPLGLALLGAAYLMGRFNRIDTPDYLRGFIKMYLNARPVSGSNSLIRHKLTQKLQDSEWHYQPKKDVQYGIDATRLMLRFGKDMTIEFAEPASPIKHDINGRWAGYVWPGAAPDLNTTAPATHIIDTSRLSLRYLEAACGGSSKSVEKTVHHTLNRELYERNSKENAAEVPEKTVTHTLDSSRLAAFNAEPGASKESAADKAIHHSMKEDLRGYVLPSVQLHTEIVHSVDADRLRYLYGEAMSKPAADPQAKPAVRHLGYITGIVPVYEEKDTVVHTMNNDRLQRHYDKTMQSRGTPEQVTKVHTFNPAKVSLALGMF